MARASRPNLKRLPRNRGLVRLLAVEKYGHRVWPVHREVIGGPDVNLLAQQVPTVVGNQEVSATSQGAADDRGVLHVDGLGDGRD